MKKFRFDLSRRIDTGSIPPWYYGYAYTEDFAHYYVFYPVPLHLVMRLWKMMQRAYFAFQFYGLDDDRVTERRRQCQSFRDGYDLGKREGYHEAFLSWAGGRRAR